MHLKLLDIFLLPKSYYNKIKNGKITLVLGILLVGIINTVSALDIESIFNPKFWSSKNIIIASAFVIIFGLVDVFFFSKPLYDVLNHLTKSDNNETLTKVMKVYISAHLTMLIYLAIIFISMLFPAILNNSVWKLIIFIFQSIILSIWFSAIITRGLNVVYKISPVYNILVFLAVYMWTFLEGNAIGYLFEVLVNKFIS